MSILILALACTVQSTFGFGLALLAVPLLIGILPVTEITPLLALISITLAIPVAWQTRASINFSIWWRLLLSASIGIPFGIALVTQFDEELVKRCLALVVIASSVHGLVTALLPAKQRERLAMFWIWPFGIVAGVLGGAYNLFGLPLVLFLQWSRVNSQAFRGTLHAFSIVINLVLVVSYLSTGLWSGQILHHYLLAVPSMIIGSFAGVLLLRYLQPQRFRHLVYGLLLIIGVKLLLGSTS